jgi:transcription-repair coupling factor (superfamily II helicase)
MVIKLTIAKTMDEAIWLREISKFIRALREQKYKE